MGQCTHCGAEVETGAAVCPECATPPPRHTRWYPGRRVVMGLLGTIAAVALIFVLAMVYFIRHTTIVTTGKNGSRVEAPSVTVTTDANPALLAKQLGLQMYPGATDAKGAQAEMNNSTIITVSFRTKDSARRVIGFYHVRYPDATVKAEGKGAVLVLVSLRDTLTIKANPSGGVTEVQVSDIQH
ncbi:MAG: hypothetical protein ACRD2D_03885 [Terriglobales bacterium]